VRITFKLFASLAEYLPRELDGHRRAGNEIAVDAAEGTSVQAVLDRFPLPRPLVHLVLVNGVFVPPEERARHPLRDGDVLAIWPPIAGG
jgi:sulfur carrier protein ThiS